MIRLNNIKIIALFMFFSFLFCQESTFFKSYKKQGNFVISGSLYNSFSKGSDFDSKTYTKIKFDYKMRGKLGIWVSILNDEENDMNIGSIGFGYFLKTKKWDLGLFTEKSFYEEDYLFDDLSQSEETYDYKLGWLYNIKKNIPIYIKYENSYHKLLNDSYDKRDKIFIGSYSIINKIILSYSLGTKVVDLLKMNFKSGEIGITVGYKFS
tara:strand:+ start:260 stop:886 length:627 start_codon:yes stop_codon:yes gene_type:complete